MPKKQEFPESPLKDEEWPLAPETELPLFLEMERQKLEANPSHALPAFNALAYIISAVWLREEDDQAEEEVILPKWVAEALATGYFRYRDAAYDGKPISLGEAYGLERRGQGKMPPIVRERYDVRDIRLVTAMAQRRHSGIKLEAVLEEMVQKTGLSLGQLRRIWEHDGKRALSALRNLRDRKSS